MTFIVRRTEPSEYRDVSRVKEIALLQNVSDDETWATRLPTWEETVSWSAWDGAECVGHAGYFLSDTTVPGGAHLPTGLVTRVGVLPTARRRGVATALMNTLTVDAADRGLALMSLRASEAVIYERYGYGVAGESCALSVDSKAARPLRGTIAEGTFRLLRHDEVLTVLPKLYERIGRRRAGSIARPSSLWPLYLTDSKNLGHNEHVVVHYGLNGEADGYVQYRTTWPEGEPARGEIDDLFGVNDAVELALWNYIVNIDLVRQWAAPEQPVDDLIRLAARDRRGAAITSTMDEKWLRLLDVDAALTGRTYTNAAGEVTIGVVDPLIATNNAAWSVSAAGARRRGDIAVDDADVVAPIEVISAAYLGGPTWADLVATTSATARSDDAVRVADELFHSPRAPYLGTNF